MGPGPIPERDFFLDLLLCAQGTQQPSRLLCGSSCHITWSSAGSWSNLFVVMYLFQPNWHWGGRFLPRRGTITLGSQRSQVQVPAQVPVTYNSHASQQKEDKTFGGKTFIIPVLRLHQTVQTSLQSLHCSSRQFLPFAMVEGTWTGPSRHSSWSHALWLRVFPTQSKTSWRTLTCTILKCGHTSLFESSTFRPTMWIFHLVMELWPMLSGRMQDTWRFISHADLGLPSQLAQLFLQRKVRHSSLFFLARDNLSITQWHVKCFETQVCWWLIWLPTISLSPSWPKVPKVPPVQVSLWSGNAPCMIIPDLK